MADQLPLFPDDPGREAFLRFHAENPHVYEWLRKQALALRRRGRTHYSARTLIHAFRFHTAMTTTDQTFKINDHVSPWYARMLMEREPELGGFFEKRRAAADREAG